MVRRCSPGPAPATSCAALCGLASERVFVAPLSVDGSFGGFHASRLSGTQIIAAGSAVYTFDAGRADSIVRVTSQVR